MAENDPQSVSNARSKANSSSATQGMTGAVLIALLVAASAVYAVFRSGMLNAVAVHLLGPPKVVIAEVYEPDPQGPSFDHRVFDELLAKHVDPDGFVDYAGLLEESESLQSYIQALAEAPMDQMGRNHRLALLMNAYNAFTLQLILDYWDDGKLNSIMDIPDDKRWDDRRWVLGGQTFSLNDLEHKEVRPNFNESRIHWALVCAAYSCPPLRPEAYVPERLEEQLEEQAEYVHQHARFYVYDSRSTKLELTQLYNWYGGDFKQTHGSVLDAVAAYSEDVRGELELNRKPIVSFIEYSWKLNDIKNRPEDDSDL